MTQTFDHFGIIGGGAWGTALGMALRRAGRQVTLWAREPEVVEAINLRHENPVFLPGIPLDLDLRATKDLPAIASCHALLLSTPAQHLRTILKQLRPIHSDVPLIVCSKGIEQNSLALMSSIIEEILPQNPLAILSGPTFAAEVARGLPTAITLALQDQNLGQHLTQAIGSRTLRPYLSNDIIGTQIGGAIKNVLAVACGIVEGRGIGDNGRAAIITRGLSELTRLGLALGGKLETFMGLSGLGDLVLTCAGAQSRNMSLGYALGQGRALADILAERKSVAEGVHTAAAAVALAKQHNIEMPICEAVDRILNRNGSVDTAIDALLARPLKQESIF